MYYPISLLTILLGASVQNAKSRYISLSFNISLTMDEDHQKQQQQQRTSAYATVLRSCMKEIEFTKAELQRFRLSLLSRDPEVLKSAKEQTAQQRRVAEIEEDDSLHTEAANRYETRFKENTPQNNAIAYEDAKVFGSDEEALQCFVYCLYEQLVLTSKSVYMEYELFAKLYAILGRERHLVKECLNFNMNNKCESSYKMRLCNSRLQMLESEERLRDAFEYGGRADESVVEEDNDVDMGENQKENTTQTQ
ncbi:uncharacterized protein LOC128868318 [Anastrepha ludens]|uniref:uncharacterized protein LOC128868318 n=1 Tax=Anastrepha ludens TaxID=28586 RepID=UPI0023B097D8|nr:uncharacterized protein LOC128868318 [Anastrepha ludens]